MLHFCLLLLCSIILALRIVLCIAALRFVILLYPLLLCSLLSSHRVSAVAVPPTPILQCLVPLRELLLEASSGLQILDALCELLLSHPSLQILCGLRGRLPSELQLVKTLLLCGNGETAEAPAKVLLREVLLGQLWKPS